MGTILTRNDDIMFDAKNISMTDSGISLYNSWPRLGMVALPSDGWTLDAETPAYVQPVTIDNVIITKNSKIDLQNDITTMSILLGCRTRAVYIVNEDGNTYAVADGDIAPIQDLNIQCTISEVYV